MLSRRLFLFVAALSAAAQDTFFLKDGDRVVFYGDSITDQRLYTTFVESYSVTRFPGRRIGFVHSGWGGDRVTGGGGGPVEIRLKRDVFAYKPTVLTIMLGMNDGRYRAFDEETFNTYADGYRKIVKSAKDALPGIRITVIQPSPYDDVTRPPNFEGGYNAVLVRYGQFLAEMAQKENLGIADLNTSVVAALEKAKTLDAGLAAKLVPDRVHPGPSGHLLMAEALLKAWNAPAVVTSVEIDGAEKRVIGATNTSVAQLDSLGGLFWTQEDRALPMPVDLKDAATALALRASDFTEALNRQTLKVTGLSGERYTLKIDGEEVGSFTRAQLAEGINLASLSTPMMKQALEVHALTLKHNNIHFARWRQVQVPLQDDRPANLAPAMDALDRLESEIVEMQRAAARPRPRRYSLAAQ